MKKITIVIVLFILSLLSCNNVKKKELGEKKVDLTKENAKASYALGVSLAENLENLKSVIEIEVMLDGIKDKLKGTKLKINEQEIPKLREYLSKIIMDKAKEEGKKFLKENSTKDGVKVTASGLQYKVLKEGKGNSPKASDKVKVHYEGKLVNGNVFDSSYKRGQPIEFPLNGVIKGWTEGLQLMKVGAKYKFFIPSELGYGERGAGNAIPPHATLIFDVELLDIVK